MFDDNPRDIMEAARWRALRPPDHYAGIQFTSQSVSSTKATTTIAPKIMSCPRTNVGRSAALIALLLGGVESSIGLTTHAARNAGPLIRTSRSDRPRHQPCDPE